MSVMPGVDMSWLPLASAGIQAGGSLLGGVLGAGAQAATNAQNFQNAEMLFNQQQSSIPAAQIQAEQNNLAMSSTAYQRTMADMKAAGLNPILAASMGPTATAGSPALTASMTPPQMGSPGNALQAGVTSASQAAQTYANTKVALQQADKDAAQTDLNKATEDVTKKTADKVVADTEQSKSATRLNDAAALNKVSEAASNYANANSANATARVNTRVAEDTERFGDSPISKAVGGLLRMMSTGVKMAPSVIPNAAKAIGASDPTQPAPPVYRRGPDGRPITDFWGRPK